MTEPDPPWHLLPVDPVRFFSLEDGYALPDLRRAYNRLIKRFKPEFFPAQFQRIRAAYDELNQALRYGEQLRRQRQPGSTDGWPQGARPSCFTPTNDSRGENDSTSRDGVVANQSVDPDRESNSVANRELRGQLPTLSVETVRSIYEDLTHRDSKTPYEYYQTAVLSDVVDPDQDSFLRWLLEGTAKFNDDWRLTGLVRRLFANVTSPDQALSYARLTSQYVTNDVYYLLTEVLWERILRQAPFSVFERQLQYCEGKLLDHSSHHQLVFYLRLLRPAIWRDDNGWAEQMMVEVGSLSSDFASWIESELHFLDLLLTYKAQRKLFLETGSVAVQIDRAIESFCVLDEHDADRAVIECQHILAASADDLIREFAINELSEHPVWSVWRTITDEVMQRHRQRDAGIQPEAMKRRVRGFVLELMKHAEPRGFHFWVNSILCSFVAVLLFDIVAICMFFWRVVSHFRQVQNVGLLSGFLMLLGVIFLSIVIGVILSILDTAILKMFYKRWLRREVFRFFETGGRDVDKVAALMVEVEKEKQEGDKIEKVEELSKMLIADRGLHLYSMAFDVLRSLEIPASLQV